MPRRAARGRSAKAQHRGIVRQTRRPQRTLKQLLLAMPDVGDDSDWNPPRLRGRRVPFAAA